MGPGRAREQRRGGAGEMMRMVNERHHMYMMSSRSQTLEHTCYNASGHSRCIDYLFIPDGMIDMAQKFSLLFCLGAGLQAFTGAPPKDHIP
eukprot:3981521-Pyramimonas_sp.AAC.1